jgi:hypothetical protein
MLDRTDVTRWMHRPRLAVALLAHDFELHVAQLYGENEDANGRAETWEVAVAVAPPGPRAADRPA